MKIGGIGILAVVMAFVFTAGLLNAEPLMEPQKKLLAKRAAQVDGYRKLAELVKGLKIDSQTYVRDFVAENDQIQTGFDTFIKGARIAGLPRYMPDGSCEVDVELTMQEIVSALTELATHCSFGHKHSFTQMSTYVQETVIRATGTGVARPDEPGMATEQNVSSITRGIPGWENITAQGRLMGERAALVDAYRNLAETVKGIKISGQTYVRDFVAESDTVQTQLDTFIKGAKQAGMYRYLPDGEVEVDVEVLVQEIVKELQTIQQHLVQQGWGWRRDEFKTINFETIVATYPAKIVRATGNGVVPAKYRLGGVESTAAMGPMTPVPSWAMGTVSAVGKGVPPEGITGNEAKLMAARAAELDARRQLTEKVYGVKIDAKTTVRDFAVQNDTVKAEVDTFLAGAVVGEPKYMDDGSVEVTVDIALEDLAEIVGE